jgi:hypothetical protein
MLERGLHNSENFSKFTAFVARGVPANRLHMAMPQVLGPGMQSKTLAGWAQTFTHSMADGELSFHLDPCNFLGFERLKDAYYKLVMGQGEGYALDLLEFDRLSDDVRHGVVLGVLVGMPDDGCAIPWYSTLREHISDVQARGMVFWRTQTARI